MTTLNELLSRRFNKKMNLHTILLDGEYKGYTIKAVLNLDPQYVVDEIINKNGDLVDEYVIEFIMNRHTSWSKYYKNAVGHNQHSLT